MVLSRCEVRFESASSRVRRGVPLTRAVLVVGTICSIVGVAGAVWSDEPLLQGGTQQPELEAPSGQRFSLTFDLTVTNQYFFRGILQESGGFILQPGMTIDALLHDGEKFDLFGTFGVWASAHDRATGSMTTDRVVSKFYEFDAFIGFRAEIDRFAFGVDYIWYTSPNDAFETLEEVAFTLSFDDSDLLFDGFAFSPTLTIAVETDGQADGGSDNGVFLGFEIAPSWSLGKHFDTEVSIGVPVRTGFSLSNYYEDPNSGDDKFFGFLSIGLALELDIPQPKGFGDWKLFAGIDYLLLGDSTRRFNNNGNAEWILHAGVSVSF